MVFNDTTHQDKASVLIRYVPGFPVSCADIGMKSFKELEINLAAARDLPPLNRDEQSALEHLIS